MNKAVNRQFPLHPGAWFGVWYPDELDIVWQLKRHLHLLKKREEKDKVFQKKTLEVSKHSVET